MVEFQEEMKYGRSSGVDFGPVDFVKYAESFGAKGYRADSKEGFEATFKKLLLKQPMVQFLSIFQSITKIISNLVKQSYQTNFIKLAI